MAMKEVHDSPKKVQTQEQKGGQSVNKDEQIGFHKGALSTLAKEREEMIKILSIVEQLMQMHVGALKELGVDLEAIAKQKAAAQGGLSGNSASKKKPLEDEIR
ncbi:hypothetical protein HY772_08745 [Candidatus Woesearchaeota archaeon]|nr:hypothetical protein [Candidatus Woesearchaeota archaeon]